MSLEMAPANQSRFSEESGPPQEFWTASVRAGHVESVRAIERSNLLWIFSIIFQLGKVCRFGKRIYQTTVGGQLLLVPL